MTKIYYFAPTGHSVASIRGLLHGYHETDTGTGKFGVAIPEHNVDAPEVIDALQAVGVLVLPSVHDSTPIPHDVVVALARHGVTPSDGTFECANKIHAKMGLPILRAHRY